LARRGGVIVGNVTATSRDSKSENSKKKKSKSMKGKLEGVSEELNLLAAQSLDWAPTRRRVRTGFSEVQKNLDHVLFKVISLISFLLFFGKKREICIV
jgi:hypothetical protein